MCNMKEDVVRFSLAGCNASLGDDYYVQDS